MGLERWDGSEYWTFFLSMLMPEKNLNRLGCDVVTRKPRKRRGFYNKSLFLVHAKSVKLGDALASYSSGSWNMWLHHSNEDMPGASHEML